MALKGRYAFLERLNWENMYNTFLGLAPREQIISLVGACLVVVIVVVLPISLLSGYLSSMQGQVEKSHRQIDDIAREIGEYGRLKDQYASIDSLLKRSANLSISSLIEGLASSANMKESINSIKERPIIPSDLFDEVVVDISLSKVTLQQLVDFLYQLEHSNAHLLRIKGIQIKTRHDNRGLLDSNFSVVTYRLTGEVSG